MYHSKIFLNFKIYILQIGLCIIRKASCVNFIKRKIILEQLLLFTREDTKFYGLSTLALILFQIQDKYQYYKANSVLLYSFIHLIISEKSWLSPSSELWILIILQTDVYNMVILGASTLSTDIILYEMDQNCKSLNTLLRIVVLPYSNVNRKGIC